MSTSFGREILVQKVIDVNIIQYFTPIHSLKLLIFRCKENLHSKRGLSMRFWLAPSVNFCHIGRYISNKTGTSKVGAISKDFFKPSLLQNIKNVEEGPFEDIKEIFEKKRIFEKKTVS